MPLIGDNGRVAKGYKAPKAGKSSQPQAFISTPLGPLGVSYGGRPGSREDIRQLQRTLKLVGLYKGSLDGIWGPKTQRAWDIYRLSPRQKKYGPYGASLGAQISYQALIAQEQRKIQQRYRELEASLRRHRAAGDLSSIESAIAMSRFWADTGGLAGGAFNKTANAARKQLRELERIQGLATKAQAQAEQQAKAQLNPAGPVKALRFLQRNLVAPISRSPVGRYALNPAFRFVGEDVLAPAARSKLGKQLIKAVELPHELVNRAYYARQLLQNQRIRSGQEQFLEATKTDVADYLGAIIGAAGGRGLVSSRIRGALEATDAPEERDLLRSRGELESIGERFMRTLQADLLALWGSEAEKRTLRASRDFRKVAGPASGPGSTVLDFVWNFVDPTLAVGRAFKAITFIDDAVKAQKVLSKAPAAVESLTRAIAREAAKAAAKAPPGLDLGDVRGLQAKIPSLRSPRGLTTELAATLASKDATTPLAYLSKLAERADAGTDVGRQFLADVEAAVSKVKDLGMTDEARQAILRASLGRTWKPRFSVGQLVVGNRRLVGISEPLTRRALAAMPYATRQAKGVTLARLMRRASKPRDATFIGKETRDPRTGGLLKFAERTQGERDAARKALRKLAKLPADQQLTSLARSLIRLPDSPLRDVLIARAEDISGRVEDYLKNLVRGLSPEEKRLLSLGDNSFAELLSQQRKLVKDRLSRLEKADPKKQATDTMERLLGQAQDRLASLQKVQEARRGAVRQKQLAKEFTQLRRDVVGLQKVQPVTFDQAVRNFNAELRDYSYMIGTKPATRVSPWTRSIRAAGRTFNDVPKSAINLHDVNERSKVMRDWTIALGMSRADADQVYARMARTMPSEDALQDIKKLQDGLIRNFLVQEGLPTPAITEAMRHIRENANEFLREYQGWYSVLDNRARRFKSQYDKVFDVDGAKDPQVLSQFQYTHPLVDPADLRRYVLEWKRANGSAAARVAAGIDIAGETLANWYAPVHYWFKFAALTLAPVRYVLRVAFMEERLRMWMEHGFRSPTEISSKYVRRLNNLSLDATAGARYFTGWEHVGIEGLPMHLLDHYGIEVTGHGLIKRGERGFTENLWHVLMFQVRPEDDVLHHLLMPQLWKGDEAGLKAARESAIEFLETTEKGRVYLHKAMLMDPKSRDTSYLVDKTESWLRSVLPNDAIVEKRLNGQFTMSELERHEEWWPDTIWGDKYDRLWAPSGPGETVRRWKALWGRLVIQTPTTSLNRQPFAYAEFVKEFDALTASGFTARDASQIAGEYAVHRTNQILYDSSVRSRFSQKLDLVFPFQQAREEMVRVWGRLIREHPARAAKTLQLFATAFNNGVTEGAVTKNQYDEWVMKVPGSPALSRALGRWAPTWVPYRRGLTQTAGTTYSFPLRSLLFVNDAWGATPRPGGPWWVSLANVGVKAFPDLFPRSAFWQKYLFDERNPTTLIFRPEVSRLWIAATGQTTIPWEPFSWGHQGYTEGAGERLRDRLAGEVGAELYAQWIRDGAKPEDKPTAKDVADATRAALFMHGLLGMFVPAPTTPTVPGRVDYNDLLKQYTVDGKPDFAAILRVRPDLMGFVFSHSKDAVREAYTREDGTVDLDRLRRENPEYWRRWEAKGSPREDGPEGLVDQIYAARDYLSPEEFVQAAERSRRMSESWREYGLILNSGMNPSEKVRALADLEKRTSDFGEWHNTRLRDYRRDLEFDLLMKQPPVVRDELLKEWQYKYDVSVSTTQKLMQDWASGEASHYNPWMEARNTADVVAEYYQNKTGLSAVSWAEKHLTPAERWNFYNYMMGLVDDVQDFNELYAARGKLGAEHGKKLFVKRLDDTVTVAEQWWSQQKYDASTTIDKKYDQINSISEQMSDIAERAKAAKGRAAGELWETYFALKDKRQRIYAEIRGIQNSLYKKFPNLRRDADEVKFLRLVGEHGIKAIRENGLDKYGIPWLTDGQEKKWNEMPERIKQDYIQDLIERLTLPEYYSLTKRGSGRLYWDYLTEFQKDMLRQRLDKKKLDTVKRMSDIAAAAEASGRGGFRRFGRRWQIDGHTLGNGFGELAFAFEMFKQFNKRGNMPEPTKELEEYKRLGDNAILKAQYLKTHPRLREWLRAGPMANMPAVVAEIVHNIMVKYGKWDDDQGVMSWDDIAELGFARTMLDRYNKRKGDAPPAYERWLKMPTGKKRFEYMKAHPEIERWLQDGPMANMPQEYREVIRDIMTKFGEWTERTDPLSVLLEQYYQTPEHAKQEFLEQHPEIVAYWRAIRTGRDRMLFDLAQSYFALPDPDSRRAYIEMHPELRDYFVDERRRRYESFLQDVARYLGRTPELAEHYLREQTKFLRELLDKFGQRPLVPSTVTRVTTRTERRA